MDSIPKTLQQQRLFGYARYKVNSLFLREGIDLYITGSNAYMLLGRKHADTGHILKNVVYLELVRRGYRVYVGKVGDQEVDFVAESRDGLAYYQVAASVRDASTLERELRALQRIHDNYPKYLLTLDEDPDADFEGIRKKNALDWLLEEGQQVRYGTSAPGPSTHPGTGATAVKAGGAASRLVRDQFTGLVDVLEAIVVAVVLHRAGRCCDVVDQHVVAGLVPEDADLRGLGAVCVGAVEAHGIELGVGAPHRAHGHGAGVELLQLAGLGGLEAVGVQRAAIHVVGRGALVEGRSAGHVSLDVVGAVGIVHRGPLELVFRARVELVRAVLGLEVAVSRDRRLRAVRRLRASRQCRRREERRECEHKGQCSGLDHASG